VADRLSMWAALFGQPGLINDQLRRYLAVTAADIQAVARAVFRDDNRVVLTYVPRSSMGNGTDGEQAVTTEVAQ